MHLIILFGVPGVGKKTVGELLAKKTGYKLFDNHRILDVVRPFIPQTNPLSVQLCRDFRLQFIDALCQTETKGLILTAAAGSAGGKAYIQTVVEKVESYGGRVSFFQLTCEYDELVRRVQLPERKGGYKLVDPDELDEWLQKDYFKGLETHPAPVIDTTHTSAEESAENIFTQLNI